MGNATTNHHQSSFITFHRKQRFLEAAILSWLTVSSCHGFSIDSLKRSLSPPTKNALRYAKQQASSNSTIATTALMFQDTNEPWTETTFLTVNNNNKKTEPSSHHQLDTLLPPPHEQPELPELPVHPPAAVSAATARILLLSAAALYGTNFAAVKYLVDDIPVGILGTLRFGLAACATLPWLLPSGTTTTTDNEWDATLAGLEVGVWTSIGYVAQAVGLETTLASTSAFVCSLAVVVVPILDYFVSGKPLQRKEQLYGIVLACVGVALLELGDTSTSIGLSSGDLLSMVQPFAFGIGFMRMERAMRMFPTEARRTTAAQLLAVFMASALFMTVHPDPNFNLSTDLMPILHNPTIWGGLIWTGIVTTALTVYMETVALQTLSAAETTLIFSTEPLWGSVAAALLLGESFGPKAMLGGGLIVTACLVSNLGMDGLREFFIKRSSSSSNERQ